MNETDFIWVDGKFVKWKEANTHILTHSLHYGGAVFEGVRCYDSGNGIAIFRLQEHVKRLFYSAKALDMKLTFTPKQIENAIINTVKKNKITGGYIRPIAYFGYGKMGLKIKGAPVNISVSCWPWGKYLSENPIKVKISSIMRIHPKSTNVEAKISGHYANSILASEDALKSGCDEALLLDYEGNIAEGPGENFFIVKKGILYTPPKGNILPGITRASVMQIAKDNNIKCYEKKLKPSDVYTADEAFFTGTAAEVTSIGFVDNHKFKNSPGPITTLLKSRYDDAVRGKISKYKKWVTLVKT